MTGVPISISPAELSSRELYRILSNTVVPRPIAWVGTVSANGIVNLAPHSFFNVFSTEPATVIFSMGKESDTLRNLREQREFTISMTRAGQEELVERSAIDFPPEESEFEWLGIEQMLSLLVAPPTVAGAPAGFECRLRDLIVVGRHHLAVGEIVMIHLHSDLPEGARIDDPALLPLARIGARYATLSAPQRIAAPDWSELCQERDLPRSG